MGKDAPENLTFEHMRDVGLAVMSVGRRMMRYGAVELEVTGFSVRGPLARGEDFLITVRAVDAEGTPVVAFHGAPELDQALQGLASRLGNGSLKWRADEFAR